MEHSLDGQVAVITGGGRGIGQKIAKALAKAGAKVVVTGRKQNSLDETAELITKNGGRCQAIAMDVLDSKAVESVFNQIISEYGSVDLLINNAGIGAGGQLPWEADVDVWWRVLEVNLRGAFLCAHAVLPNMIENKKGRIINLGSNIGFHPSAMASAYAVSKSALLHLTSSIAEAAQEHNVSAFVVSPGLVLTDMTQDVPVFKNIPASEWTPIERVAELCAALATGKADKLTGRY
ncbi:MAG: SDR family oxidoreductase, partial [Chloroflexota bacterium]